MKIALNVCAFIGMASVVFGMAALFLHAADREAAFQENIRFARCERMDAIERNAMRKFCDVSKQ